MTGGGACAERIPVAKQARCRTAPPHRAPSRRDDDFDEPPRVGRGCEAAIQRQEHCVVRRGDSEQAGVRHLLMPEQEPELGSHARKRRTGFEIAMPAVTDKLRQ